MNIILFIVYILNFINRVVIPLILAIAFIAFLWNAFRFFFWEGGSEDGRKKAKSLMLWGLIGFIVIVSIWGIVNMFVYGLGFGYERSINPDYIEQHGPRSILPGGFWRSTAPPPSGPGAIPSGGSEWGLY